MWCRWSRSPRPPGSCPCPRSTPASKRWRAPRQPLGGSCNRGRTLTPETRSRSPEAYCKILPEKEKLQHVGLLQQESTVPYLLLTPLTVGAFSLRKILVQLLVSAILVLLMSGRAHAGPLPDDRRVAAVIQDYLQGSSYNRPEQLRRAFHPDARLYLSQGASGMREVGVDEYVGWFSQSQGQFNGRFGRLISTQIEGNIATAKAEILVGKDQARFVDLFLL